MNTTAQIAEIETATFLKFSEIFAEVTNIPREKIPGFIGLHLENENDLLAKVDHFIKLARQTEVSSSKFERLDQACTDLGRNEIKMSIAVSNYILDRPVESIDRTLMDESSTMQILYDLRKVMIDLDPKGHDFSGVSKVLNFTAKNRLKSYLAEYETSQDKFNAIFESLHLDKIAMVRESSKLAKEKTILWRLMQLLHKYAFIADVLSERLFKLTAEYQETDPSKAQAITNCLLTKIKRRKKDFYQQLKLCAVGYLLLEMLRANQIKLSSSLDNIIAGATAAVNSASLVQMEILDSKTLEDGIATWRHMSKKSLSDTMQMLKEKVNESNPNAELLALLTASSEAFFMDLSQLWKYKWYALSELQMAVVSFVEEADKSLNYLVKHYDEDWYSLMAQLSDNEVGSLVNRAAHIL